MNIGEWIALIIGLLTGEAFILKYLFRPKTITKPIPAKDNDSIKLMLIEVIENFNKNVIEVFKTEIKNDIKYFNDCVDCVKGNYIKLNSEFDNLKKDHYHLSKKVNEIDGKVDVIDKSLEGLLKEHKLLAINHQK
jgi:hypothetical protein